MAESTASEKDASDEGKPKKPRAKRVNRPFPAVPFEDALTIGEAIAKFAGGSSQMRRITLFEELGKAPDSGPSRALVTNSSKYGISTGSYQAEFLTLTDAGAKACDPDTPERERLRARCELAIEHVPAFKSLYEAFAGNKLPSQQVMRDHLTADGMGQELAQEAVELFIVNTKFLGLLRPVAGTERILTIDHRLDELPSTPARRPKSGGPAPPAKSKAPAADGDWGNVCFYITPIGDEGSEQRKHADVVLGQIVEPAVEALGLGLKVVRADQIDKPGLITSQVIEHIVRSKLVVADLSFHNPNVFYELALRHAIGKPAVQVTRVADSLPFDVADVRTVRIDMADIHAFVTQMETWRAELTNQARQALEDPESAVSPLSALGGALFESFRVQ